MQSHNFTLINHINIPKLAFGTYELPKDDVGYDVMKNAFIAGYRHIDSTYGYDNEHIIIQAMHDAKLKRKDVFITSKLWNADQGYDSALTAFEKACSKFETDYLDLFLIRWPIPIGRQHDYQTLNQDTWRAFEQLYREKRVRAIGVCNFLVHHLVPLMAAITIKPMVNQLEFNPFYQQREVVSYCQQHDILVASWAPIRAVALEHPGLIKLASKYTTDVSQICLAYCLTKNVLPITYTQLKKQLESNTKVFDLTLAAEDVAYLDSLNTITQYTFHPDRHEEWFA